MTGLDLEPDLATYFDTIMVAMMIGNQIGGTSRRGVLELCEKLSWCFLIVLYIRCEGPAQWQHHADRAGRLVHLDFGWQRDPGGLNFEDAPFKLPDEYVRVLGGVEVVAGRVLYLRSATCALAADLRARATLAIFFGDAPFGADAARVGGSVCGPRRGSRRTVSSRPR